MRIYTVMSNGRPAAVVRAESASDAIDIACDLVGAYGMRGPFAAREPNDAEMVSWLAHRDDHLLPEATLAEAS